MKPIDPPTTQSRWSCDSLADGAAQPPSERRERIERRQRIGWSLIYGSFNPRRRRPPRRLTDSRFHSLDWHSAHLLAVAIAILLLSVADALMTVRLLAGGADEVNPLMAAMVERSASMFAVVKMGLTGVGVMVMVMLARYRFMRRVRVDRVMYCVMLGYAALLAYEFSMVGQVVDPAGY